MSSPDVDSDPVTSAPSLVRAVFGHGATYVLGAVVSQGIAFLLFPFFAHVFVPRDYGVIDLVGLAMTLVNLTIAFEISQGLGRYFAEATTPGERQSLASTALIFTAFNYTLAAALAFVFVRPLTVVLLGENVRTSLMKAAIVVIWSSGLLNLAQTLLRWQLRPKAFTVVSITTASVTAGMSAILVLGIRTGVIGALIGQLAGFGAGGVLAFALCRDLFRFRFDRDKLTRMLAYSTPLMASSAGVFLNGYADRIAIRSQLSLADVGVYGVGYRFSMIVSLTLLGFQGALMPLLLSRHERPETRRELAHVFRIFCVLALAVFLLVSLFADELLRLLARPAYYRAAGLVPLLVAASFFGGMYIFAPGLSIAKRTRPWAVVFALSGVVNIALAFGLIGLMGLRGPAIGFLVACAGSFAVLMALSQRLYPVPHDWGRLLSATAVVAALVATGRGFLGGTVDVQATLGKIAIAACGLALISRLLRRDELAELARLLRRSAQALRSSPRRVRPPRRARRA